MILNTDTSDKGIYNLTLTIIIKIESLNLRS